MILIFSYQDYKKNIVFSPEYRKLYFQIQYKSINKVARDSVTAASWSCGRPCGRLLKGMGAACCALNQNHATKMLAFQTQSFIFRLIMLRSLFRKSFPRQNLRQIFLPRARYGVISLIRTTLSVELLVFRLQVEQMKITRANWIASTGNTNKQEVIQDLKFFW